MTGVQEREVDVEGGLGESGRERAGEAGFTGDGRGLGEVVSGVTGGVAGGAGISGEEEI